MRFHTLSTLGENARATAEGWTEIDYVPDLPMANFVGVCPECREKFRHRPTGDK